MHMEKEGKRNMKSIKFGIEYVVIIRRKYLYL